MGIWVNSLWPNGAIWRSGTRSTLPQVMACCLTAPSHYLNIDLSSVRSLGIHLRALSLDDVKIPINKTRLKIAVLKHLGLPGANEGWYLIKKDVITPRCTYTGCQAIYSFSYLEQNET